MGRLSRYKKIKSIDPFAKNGSWKSDIGDTTTLRRVKKKSKTSLKMKEDKMNKLKGRKKKKGDDGADRKSGGCNGFGEDDGYDLPPDGEDEFDLNDMLGTVKKHKRKTNLLLDTNSASHLKPVSSSGGGEKWTATVEKDRRGIGAPSNGNKDDNNTQSSKNQKNKPNNSNNKANTKLDGTLTITAKTSIREIIEAHKNPETKKQTKNKKSPNALTKQEKKKAFLNNKKLKKRKRGNGASDDEDEEEYANQQALHALHSQSRSSSTQPKQAKTKEHAVKQQNHTHTMVARSVMDIQVERPPTFTTLPRGANKLAKNQKAKHSNKNEGNTLREEDDNAKAQRIRKEQQALEAMREKVMKQYAILRESRRSR